MTLSRSTNEQLQNRKQRKLRAISFEKGDHIQLPASPRNANA